jgi:hypothetical protein
MAQRIHIPSIYASRQLEALLEICHPILLNPTTPIILDFSQCKFLAHHGVVVLGAIAHQLKTHQGCLTLDLATLAPAIRTNLAQNGLLHYLGYDTAPWDGNSIPFRHDLRFEPDRIVEYLSQRWLGRGWVNISQTLKDEIIGQVLEIYLNAFEHGQSTLGVFSCGQYYPNKKRLKLTILDRGIGIPQNVRKFRQQPDLSAEQALAWAFQQGNSTQPIPNTARGLGLDSIRAFIGANQGKLQLYSHDAWAKISGNQHQYGGQTATFQGTIVNIDLVCDSDYYCLSSELPDRPFF